MAHASSAASPASRQEPLRRRASTATSAKPARPSRLRPSTGSARRPRRVRGRSGALVSLRVFITYPLVDGRSSDGALALRTSSVALRPAYLFLATIAWKPLKQRNETVAVE